MVDVGCVGLLVEDRFCGPMAAIPPEGALLLLDDMPVRAGGCAANVAIDLAKQGLSVDVVGCVGADGAADMLARSFVDCGVGATGLVRLDDVPTSTTVVLLVEGQDRRYIHVTGANSRCSVGHVSRAWIAKLKIFYLGGLFALPGIDMAELAELLTECRALGVRTVVDVVVPQDHGGMERLRPLLPLIDVFLPNGDEAAAFTGLSDPYDQLKAFQSAGADLVVITRGREGSIAGRGDDVWSCGAYAMDVVDPSGSGDAFASGIIAGLLAGHEVPDLLRYASAVGASATRAAGTTQSVFSASEAWSFVAEHPLSVRHHG